MNTKKNQTIVYVNFTPYENTGRILDYLLTNFSSVILFSFNFHQLTKGKNNSNLLVYKNGKQIYHCTLHQLPVSQSLVFTLLPLRSFLISGQIIYHLFRLKKRFGPYDIFFTVNAFTAFVGNILRNFGVFKKTIVWVWDYYPPKHPNKIIQLMRWIYWQFDKQITNCNKVVFLNSRLQKLRKDIGVLPKNKRYQIVNIGTDMKEFKVKNNKKIVLAFVGVLKKSQGLDLAFNAYTQLAKEYKNIYFEIIGGGPDEKYFKQKAKSLKVKANFHGYINDENVIRKILNKSTIGIAPYVPEESNVSYYGDPSKIKIYLSLGLPVITTNVFVFAEEIQSAKAGIILNDYFEEEFIKALKKITKSYNLYAKRAYNLAKKYEYRVIYQKLFN